jgi:hypothetical protein
MAVCPECDSERVSVNRYNRNGTRYFRCNNCKCHFSDEEKLPQGGKDKRKFRSTGKNSAEMEGVVQGKRSGGAPSLEDIIAKFDVDLKIWEVDKYVVNEWHMGYKDDAGRPGSHPLYQCKVWLVRKIAIETDIPPIQPIRTYASIPQYTPSDKRPAEGSALILPDAHVGYRRDMRTGKLHPFHDRHVWDIAFQVANELQPDVIVIQGDALDCAEWTDKFMRTPEVFFTFQPSLVELNYILTILRITCPDSEIVYLQGNHEQRIENMLAKYLNCAFGVTVVDHEHPAIAIPHLLDLDTLGVKWVDGYPDEEIWLNSNLSVVHGSKSATAPGASAEKYLRESRHSVCFAHVHRSEKVSKTRYLQEGERFYSSFCFGMMGNPRRTPAKGTKHDWQQGIGVIYYDSMLFDSQHIPIYGNRAVWNGQIIEGEDFTDQLRGDTAWEAF